MPSVILVGFETLGKQHEAIVLKMLQEFKNAKGTLTVTPSLVPTAPLSSPLLPELEGIPRAPLWCVPLWRSSLRGL